MLTQTVPAPRPAPNHIQLRDYQVDGINRIAELAGSGITKIVFQLATGGGKSLIFSALTQRFQSKIKKRVVIAVHRDTLLEQACSSLESLGIKAGRIVAGQKNIVLKQGQYLIPYNRAEVVVCMVETLHNRLKKYQDYLGDVGMLIIDEAHLWNFNKILDYFPSALVVGFTATPVSANKKEPLNKYFQEIVAPTRIQDLIDAGFLAKNISFKIKGGINRKKLAVKGGEFDEKLMAGIYSATKHVDNCVTQYEKYALGEKTAVFNCNIEHSKLVTDAFTRKGYNCRHLDGTQTRDQQQQTLDWFANTNDAILCSVALLTTGWDEPSIETVIINRATMSLPLFLQMTGRGSRPIPGIKSSFKIIDLGHNIETHMDWNYPHDWHNYFHNPERASKRKGPAPTKLCPNCDAMIHLSTTICPFCEHVSAKPEQYDTSEIELEILTKGIDIDKLIQKNQGYKPYRALHLAKNSLVSRFRAKYKGEILAQGIRDLLNIRYQLLVKDWCEAQDKPYNKFHKDLTKRWLFDELDRVYGKIDR